MNKIVLILWAGLAAWGYCGTEVAAIYYPHWHPYPAGERIFGAGRCEYDLVRRQKPRYPGHPVPIQPSMGYYDETNPAVVAKEIDLAADAGIGVFLFDWYFYGREPMMQEALDRGFLKAPNAGRMRFALMWCYHDRRNRFGARPEDPGAWIARREQTPEEFRRCFAYVLEHYLTHPLYWRKNGRPFFSIFNAHEFIRAMGGPAKTKALLAEAYALAARKGLPPVYWHAMQGDAFAAYRDAGFSACSAYNITCHDCPDYWGRFKRGEQLFDYAEVAQAHRRIWRERANLPGLTYLPTVTRGWDCSARCHPDEAFPWRDGSYPYSGIVTNNSPQLFQSLLADAKTFAETAPCRPEAIIINAWNEYTEGCWLVPDKHLGNASLQAVRAIFNP